MDSRVSPKASDGNRGSKLFIKAWGTPTQLGNRGL